MELPCGECPAVSRSALSAKHHALSHRPAVPCRRCHRRFRTSDGVRRHRAFGACKAPTPNKGHRHGAMRSRKKADRSNTGTDGLFGIANRSNTVQRIQEHVSGRILADEDILETVDSDQDGSFEATIWQARQGAKETEEDEEASEELEADDKSELEEVLDLAKQAPAEPLSCARCGAPALSPNGCQRHQGEELGTDGEKQLKQVKDDKKADGRQWQMCRKCGYAAPTARLVAAHLQARFACDRFLRRKDNAALLARPQPNKCPKCDKLLTTFQALKFHLIRSKQCGRRQTYLCPKCGRGFKELFHLTKHMESPNACRIYELEKLRRGLSTKGGKPRCLSCPYEAPSVNRMTEHLKSSKACQKQRRKQQIQHLISQARQSVNLATAKEANETELESSNQHGEYACDKCGRSFSKWMQFYAHQHRSSKCGQQKAATCPKCEKLFTGGSAALQRHGASRLGCERHLVSQRRARLSSELPDGRHACRRCHFATSIARRFRHHFEVDPQGCVAAERAADGERLAWLKPNTHLDSRPKPRPNAPPRPSVACPNCGRNFPANNLAWLRRHMDSPKACQRFKLKELLKGWAGVCPKCQRLFPSNQRLMEHLKHSPTCGERRDFACDECGKAFGVRAWLRRHHESGKGCRLNLRKSR